jgi:hypothetical protein
MGHHSCDNCSPPNAMSMAFDLRVTAGDFWNSVQYSTGIYKTLHTTPLPATLGLRK